jgi:hypothetical protein
MSGPAADHRRERAGATRGSGAWGAGGAVTGTEFGRAKIGKPSSDSGHGGGSPCPERFVSEDAERAAGCEMALDVESVLDGGVNRQEALG